MKIQQIPKKIIEWVNNINQRQWFLASIITSTVGIWFPLILPFLGVYFHLVSVDSTTGEKELTFLGWILTIITVLWSFLSTIAQKYSEKVNFNTNSKDEVKGRLITPLKASFYTLCNLKLNTLIKKIKEAKAGTFTLEGSLVEKPCVQLEETSRQIAFAVSEILTEKAHNIRPDDLYISIYYNFPLEGEKWVLADKYGEIKGLSVDELVDENTLFSKLINNKKEHIYFYNSKQKAYEEGMYLPDQDEEYDKKKNLLGSILCYKRTFKSVNSENLIQCVICISTNRKYMLKKPSEDAIANFIKYMDTVLLKEFSVRIGIELCLHYLHRLSKKAEDT